MQIDYEKLLSRPEWRFNQGTIDEYLAGKRVLITGAGGSIGSAIAKRIARSEANFLACSGHSELPIFNLQNELLKTKSKVKFHFSVLDVAAKEMEFLLGGVAPDIIIHAAAHKHVGLMESQPEEAFRNNTLGTINLAKQCLLLPKVPKFIFISTDKAAKPTTVMGASKRLAELWLLANYPNSRICRFGNVLGSSGSLIEIAIRKATIGETLTINDPMMKRYFITPDEAVGLVLTSGIFDKNYPAVFSIWMGAQENIVDVIMRLDSQIPRPLTMKIGNPGSGEKIVEDLFNPGEYPVNTAHSGIFEIACAGNLFNVKQINQVIYEAVDTLHNPGALVAAANSL